MAFWVYMLRCVDQSFYVGHTDDLERRVAQHHEGVIVGYTHTRRPLQLVWQQDFTTREEALSAERQVKGWSRTKKQALAAGDWKEIRRLAWGKRNPMLEELR